MTIDIYLTIIIYYTNILNYWKKYASLNIGYYLYTFDLRIEFTIIVKFVKVLFLNLR